MKKSRVKIEGQVLLIGIILVLLLLSIFVPGLMRHAARESKQTIKNSRVTRAFNLAEAGIDRGIWKVKEDPQNWEDAQAGVALANFCGDASSVYSDVGGEYRIKIGPGPTAGQISIVSVGRDLSTNEVRAVEAVYTRGLNHAVISVGNFQYLPDFHVHWGPVTSYGSLFVSTGTSPTPHPAAFANTYYPRKYAKLGITNRDSNPTPPNSDSTEYWAYQADLGDPPVVDLSYYKNRAENNDVPLQSPTFLSSCPPGSVGEINSGPGVLTCSGGPFAVAHTLGKGYFTKAENPAGQIDLNAYVLKSTSTVLYFDDLYVNNLGFLDIEALILAGPTGSFNIIGSNEVYQATIPVHARDEYRHPTSAPIWTMANPPVPDLPFGFPPSFDSVGEGHCCYPIGGIQLRAFVYVGGTIQGSGTWGGSFVGAMVVAGPDIPVHSLYRDLFVFYDVELASKVKLKNNAPKRVSWREVPGTW